jgi:hypothetical protein
MPSITLVLSSRKDTADMVVPGQPKENLKRLLNELNGINAGRLPGKIDLSASAASTCVAASGTFTLVSAIATDAVTVGKTVFTFTSTPSVSTATAQDVEVDGADDTADAAALAAAINTNAATSAYCYATSASNVVTVTCRIPGVLGNLINISSADATITASATYLAGGTGGTGSSGTTLTTLSRV